jgi:hypothetical protein
MNTAFAVKTLASVAALVMATRHAKPGFRLPFAGTIAATRFRRTLD